MTKTASIKTEYQVTVNYPVWQRVEQIAEQFNLSISELLEHIAKGQLKVVAVSTNSEPLSDRDIANYFIWLASQSDVEINAYKLQKLIYYAQAWHLAIYGTPLFNADFQAWVHGPVIPALLERYTSLFRWEPIAKKMALPYLVCQTNN